MNNAEHNCHTESKPNIYLTASFYHENLGKLIPQRQKRLHFNEARLQVGMAVASAGRYANNLHLDPGI